MNTVDALRSCEKLSGIALLIGGLSLSACTETRYVDYDEGAKQEDLTVKVVAYQIDPGFYKNFPNCVLIMPPGPMQAITPELSLMIEKALARHLERRFDRVVDELERKIALERFDLDIKDPIDQASLSKRLQCDAVLHTEVLNPRIDYLLVWTQVGLGLEMKLVKSSNEQLLWKARHKARRSEGGLSLSPIGALADTVFSTRFAVDRDVAEGVVDDAVRRMVVPLPNTRSF